MHKVEVKNILSQKNGMNVYRGCTHGCIYCDARSTCYQMNHEFTDIEVKINAPQLLEMELYKKEKKCMIGTGSMSDPYNHYEETLLVTRKCLEVIDKYGFGISILTKSTRFLRDMDLLKSINKKGRALVQMTLTTIDDNICRLIEPNVSLTSERIEALKKCYEEGIETIVWMTPILPFINDTLENIDGIIDACIDSHVKEILCFDIGVTLREGDREYFYECLDKIKPGLKEKYISTYGNRYECSSINNYQLIKHFKERCFKAGIICDIDKIFALMNYFPQEEQLLFDF